MSSIFITPKKKGKKKVGEKVNSNFTRDDGVPAVVVVVVLGRGGGGGGHRGRRRRQHQPRGGGGGASSPAETTTTTPKKVTTVLRVEIIIIIIIIVPRTLRDVVASTSNSRVFGGRAGRRRVRFDGRDERRARIRGDQRPRMGDTERWDHERCGRGERRNQIGRRVRRPPFVSGPFRSTRVYRRRREMLRDTPFVMPASSTTRTSWSSYATISFGAREDGDVPSSFGSLSLSLF